MTDCVSDDNDVDSVRLLKLSLIAAHPQSSQVIREKTGMSDIMGGISVFMLS